MADLKAVSDAKVLSKHIKIFKSIITQQSSLTTYVKSNSTIHREELFIKTTFHCLVNVARQTEDLVPMA